MEIEIIDKQDLEIFKKEILQEMNEILNGTAMFHKKEWIKAKELLEILDCSKSTLQNLRDDGSLSPSKIGGTYYYKYSEVLELFEKNRI
ncbi:MAG: helix-turn-helix domain-containing protein [Promethearchaeota archaeon]|jgi:hypothetical protein